MKKLPKNLNDDFTKIVAHLDNIVNLVLNGDTDKLSEFPPRHLMEKGLRSENFRAYMFDAGHRLVMFAPFKSDELVERFLPFERKYTLTEEESVSSLKEFISTERKHLRHACETGADIEDVFFIVLFGGNVLLRSFQIGSTQAVVFALSFADLNVLDYNDYDLDFSLNDV